MMIKPIRIVRGVNFPDFWVGVTCQKCGVGKYQKTEPKGLNILKHIIGMYPDKLKCDNPECGNEVAFD